jgi:RNA polymerase sigma factor (sigma-70 family)
MKPFATAPEINERPEEETKPDDLSLIARARQGDQAAFYDLVRRHREKACSIARSLMRDHHLAEDIVQEALVRAFLQLGTLVDGNRFLPWFHRIVRTQAWMKLRRGGWYRREMPFSGLVTRTMAVDSNSGHWENIDHVLYHLRKRSEDRIRFAEDPSVELVRKEILDAIGGLLVCLNRKERDIFEAHFFGELSPKEIAELFQTTPAYVYNSISRAKMKLQNERLRVFVNGYVHQRRIRGLPVKKILNASIIHFK